MVSVSGLMRKQDIDAALPHAELLLETANATMANGGSCVASPDGEWLLPPVTDEERLSVVEEAPRPRDQAAEHASRVPALPRILIGLPARLWIRLPDPSPALTMASQHIRNP